MTMVIDGSAGVTFPNSTIQASAGRVLQVVNTTFSTIVSSSSSTFADSGMSLAITPTFSTSKILINVCIGGSGKYTSNTALSLKLLRGSTSLLIFEGGAGYTGGTGGNSVGTSGTTYLDSPATTSSTTYKIQLCSTNGSGTVYMNDAWSGTTATVSTITLMEIAA